ncbi:hypothetical protein AC579_5058 [Pseudocercospora musae]|uniref:Uncharacterized protein n=1 Tax=Pseudocercospora musae TaxID=113226 RepID=A0A139I7G1_9PEZI|nr:hypothetical protein AC579_5058 [Pseudocercospora musae]
MSVEAGPSFSRQAFYHASPRPLSMAAEQQVMGISLLLLNAHHPSSLDEEDLTMEIPDEEEGSDNDGLTRVNSYDFVLDQAKVLGSEQHAADFLRQSVSRPEPVYTRADVHARAERGGLSRSKKAGIASYWAGNSTWDEVLDYLFCAGEEER